MSERNQHCIFNE